MKKIFSLAILLLLTITNGWSFATIYGVQGSCVGTASWLGTDSSAALAGTWNSSNIAVAQLSGTSGYSTVVNGISVGTAIISFTVGGVVSTYGYTVSAVPAAITGGPVTVCPGATATFADATPGGTWATGSATIASITSGGTATGLSGGGTIIYYSVGPGCAAETAITVTSAPIDSVWGPAMICTGSSELYTSPISGGVWSSSNAAIATVNSAGLVTGIAPGMAYINHTITGTCGLSSTSPSLVTISSTTAPGTISGITFFPVGSSTTLSATVSGGTWSSSNAGVATVDLSGNVTGLTLGTSTISYAVTGCSGLAYASAIVNVTPFDGISGHVTFPSYPYHGNVKVWLIKYNAATHILSAVDSMNAYSAGSATGVYYQFSGLSSDSFRIKADAPDTFMTTTSYLPTYHTSSYYWNSASVVNHTAGTADINKDIIMGIGASSTGPGFIAGDVTMGANKGTAGSVPSTGLLIYAINDATGTIMQQTKTDAAGHYSFSNLPVGTYRIYPELINYATTPYSAISLSGTAPSMTAASFQQHTISYKISPIHAAAGNINTTLSHISAFPNPTTGKLNVNYEVAATEQATMTVTDVTGRAVYSTFVTLTKGAGTAAIDLSAISNGLYMISIKSASVNYNSKIQVQK